MLLLKHEDRAFLLLLIFMEEKVTFTQKKEEQEEININETKKRKLFWERGIKLLIGLVLFLLVVSAPLSLYYFSPLNSVTYPLLKIVPYPVALVKGRQLVTSREWISSVEAIKQFYQSQDFSKLGLRVDFSTEEGKYRLKIKEKDVLDKLIENKIAERLCQEKGITVSKKEAQKELVTLAQQAGDLTTLALNTRSLYGWSLNKFRDEIIIPRLCLKKLMADFNQHNSQQDEAINKIKQAEKELKEDNTNFSAVAQKYSEGKSAQAGGEIGWITEDKIIPAVAKAVSSLHPGERSQIIESPLGWHIILVEDLREVEKEGKTIKELRLKQIFVRGNSFTVWFLKQKQIADILILTREYRWNKQKGEVEFRDEGMRKKEEILKAKDDGDPSLLLS